jgi:hypothetical protein
MEGLGVREVVEGVGGGADELTRGEEARGGDEGRRGGARGQPERDGKGEHAK